MKDIAKDLGLSVITVSKVLRNHPDISVETRERVLRRVKEVNYQPNLAARALVTGRTHCIGLIVPDLVHPFFAELGKGISATLRRRGYGLLLASSEEDTTLELNEVNHMLARGVDAIIIASGNAAADSLGVIEERGVPYVLVDRSFAKLRANFVGTDDQQIGEMATGHLIEAGCRRIAHIRGPAISTAKGRLKGYLNALRRHRMPAPKELVVLEQTGDNAGEASGADAMLALLRLKPRPDGVFCYNDPAAMGAMQSILDAGLRIPQDIALIGCGNVAYAPFLRVPLSTIDQQSAEMGGRAGELALSIIEARKPPEPQTVLIQPKLIVRASTARRPPGERRTPKPPVVAAITA